MSIGALIAVRAITTLPIAAQLSLVFEFKATISELLEIRTIFAFAVVDCSLIFKLILFFRRQLQILIRHQLTHVIEVVYILIDSCRLRYEQCS